MLTLPILSRAGKEIDTVNLPKEIFGVPVNTDVLHQAMVMHQASLRQGNASTKERGAVSGGGKKPWRQKGTGRARAGSSRSPLWAGGGVVFGPHPRDFGYTIPKKIKRAALRESLNAKYQSKTLICLEEFKGKIGKTKEFAEILTTLKLQGKILALLDGCDESVKLFSRNIPRFEMLRCEDVNAYDVLRNKNLLLTKTSLNKILERVK
ncbi:MAG: 50S ribosomal protein L4 [Candidatus Omnitrophica bacterium]|nr:50S ribosomal protein L4 [Candidatus Omnitrophota bacterium]